VPAACPVPVNEMVCGLPVALSVMLMLPVCWPAAAGVNVTAMEQPPPAATDVPHVLVCAKSPVTVMPVIDSGAFPLLVNVTVCAALVVWTFCAVKVRLDEDSVTDGAAGCSGVEELPHAAWPMTMARRRPASAPVNANRPKANRPDARRSEGPKVWSATHVRRVAARCQQIAATAAASRMSAPGTRCEDGHQGDAGLTPCAT